MTQPINRARIMKELEAAQAARKRGNEGMARVCARRAAGWAIGLRFETELPRGHRQNAYRLLGWYSQRLGEPDDQRRAAERLTARITEDHALPHEQDPLEDARSLVAAMLGS